AGKVYYVSPSGSDEGPGTVDRPFATLAKGAGLLRPGDTLYLRGGTYADNLVDKLKQGGASWTAPVTLAAYPGERPVLRPGAGKFVARVMGGGKSYVQLVGLTLDGTGTTSSAVYIVADGTGAPDHIRLRDCEVRHAATQGIMVQSVAGRAPPGHNEFLGLKVHDNGTTTLHHGFYLQSNHNLVDGCEVYGNAGLGVQVYK